MTSSRLIIASLALALGVSSFGSAGCADGMGDGSGRGGQGSGSGGMNLAPIGTLNETHEEGLRYMREEEKLARDVYITLGARWGHPTFENIQGAEQRHMNAIGNLLVRYGVDDPIKDDTVGVFANPELAELYVELVAEGDKSLLDALEVGKLIEEIDIDDLEAEMDGAPDDVRQVYGRLLNGSYNHLDAFTNAIDAL